MNAAKGRFLDGEMVGVLLALVEDDMEPLRAATARVKAAAGFFFAGRAVEELAVGSVPLSPSSPAPALRFLLTPPRKGVVSQIVKPACAGTVGSARAVHVSAVSV